MSKVLKKGNEQKDKRAKDPRTSTRFPGVPDDQIIECTPTQIREWSVFPKLGGAVRSINSSDK